MPLDIPPTLRPAQPPAHPRSALPPILPRAHSTRLHQRGGVGDVGFEVPLHDKGGVPAEVGGGSVRPLGIKKGAVELVAELGKRWRAFDTYADGLGFPTHALA